MNWQCQRGKRLEARILSVEQTIWKRCPLLPKRALFAFALKDIVYIFYISIDSLIERFVSLMNVLKESLSITVRASPSD